MSRMTIAILVGASSAAATAAPPVTADQAMANYRSAFQSPDEIDCPNSGAADEIVVCGKRPDGPNPYRLPLPVEAVPGQRTPGEATSAREVAGKLETCSTVGPNQQCGGGLDVIGMAAMIAKVIGEKVIQEVVDLED